MALRAIVFHFLYEWFTFISPTKFTAISYQTGTDHNLLIQVETQPLISNL